MESEELPAAGRTAGPPTACENARHLLAVFCRGRLTREEDREFRAHVMECEECRRLYRETVSTLANLGRTKRQDRARRARLANRRYAIEQNVRPRRRFGLRLALLPAILIAAIVWWQPFTPRLELVLGWEEGEVRAGDRVLSADERERGLERGEWCEIGPGAEAWLAGPGLEATVASDSYFLVEGARAARLRLMHGGLELHGVCVVTTSWGVLELGGASARIELVGGRIEVACLRGEATWIGPLGERRLQAGESWSTDDLLGEPRL